MTASLRTIHWPVHGSLYRRILEFGAQRGFRLLLVEPPGIPLDASARALLAKLAAHQVKAYRANSWPGTVLLKEEAAIHEYELTASSINTVLEASGDISAWLAPSLPEDPCLLRRDGSPWFVATTHEQDVYFEATADEMADLLEAIPELREHIA